MVASFVLFAMLFTPPNLKQRLAAIGRVDDLPPNLRAAFTPGDDFRPIPKPAAADWLANHAEEGQTFEQFIRSKPNKPDGRRNKLYLQPLGEFRPGDPSLEELKAFADAFFMMSIEVLPELAIADAGITTRSNPHTRNTQLLTTDILDLLRRRLPDDAFALLGITMTDLYPDPIWNFVFGQASLRQRVGVYSFARYDPRFYGEQLTAQTQALMLRRSCKVLAHETTHMFGVHHCIYYHCLENGSNHLQEADARPLHLCPVDLRKLQWSIGFDPVERYRKLLDFARAQQWQDEAQWLDARIARIVSGPSNAGGR